MTAGQIASQITLHGVVGGIAANLNGGDFWDGFASGSLSKAVSPQIHQMTGGNAVAGTVLAGVVGGTISKLTGGNFSNGARTAALAYALNELRSHGNKMRLRRVPESKPMYVVCRDKNGNPVVITKPISDIQQIDLINLGGRGKQLIDEVMGITLNNAMSFTDSLAVRFGRQRVQDYLVMEKIERVEWVMYDPDDPGSIVGDPMPDPNGGSRRTGFVHRPIEGTARWKPFSEVCLLGDCSSVGRVHELLQ